MKTIRNLVIKRRGIVVAVSLLLTLIFGIAFFQVDINYNMTDYLPEDANSTIALQMMEKEFGEAVPNCSVLVEDVSIQEALQIKEELGQLEGIEQVTWLDDAVDLKIPLEVQDEELVNDYYKNRDALFSITVTSGQERAALDRVRSLLGEEVKLSGNAADQAEAQRLAVSETLRAICILAPLIILILIIATTSWVEPLIYLTAIGASVFVNLGSEIFRGEISYVTLAVGPMLQMAVSIDYAVFLSGSFKKFRREGFSKERAMGFALKDSSKSIAASALTTIFGFLALTLMKFRIGPDMGICLVKGVVLSFIFCMTFLPALILFLDPLIEKTKHKNLMPDFTGAGRVVTKIAVPALILVFAMTILCYPAQKNNDFIYGTGDTKTADAVYIDDRFETKNTMVVLVPKGDRGAETMLSKEIEDMPHVTSVMSYATQVGAPIPPEYLGSDIADNFYGEHYTRIIIYSDLDDECEEAFTLVEDVRNAASNYYGNDVYSCGQSANLYDMKHTINVDNNVVNIVTVLAIYLVLLFMTRSWFLPIPLILAIKIAIWVNMSIPFFTGTALSYLGYLVVGTVQMGATIDYAILLSNNYLECRKRLDKKKAMAESMAETIPSVLVSASILAIAGFALASVSSNGIVIALGVLLGRGALLPLLLVNLFLPALLMILDKFISITIIHSGFYRTKSIKVVYDYEEEETEEEKIELLVQQPSFLLTEHNRFFDEE